MIKINLLPYRDIQKQEKIWFQFFSMIGAVILALLIVGVVHWRFISYENALKVQKDELTNEIAELDKKIGQIDKIKSQKSEIERKLSVIDMLNNKRIYATDFLYKVANAVPDKLWLVTIEEREKEVVFTGEAELASYVSDFMNRLTNTGLFKTVTLVSLEQSAKGESKVIRFMLNTVKVEHGTKP